MDRDSSLSFFFEIIVSLECKRYSAFLGIFHSVRKQVQYHLPYPRVVAPQLLA